MLETIAATLAPEFDVVGTVVDGMGAVAAVGTLRPDVIVLDLSMPILSGIDVTRRLANQGSRTAVVILTVHEDAELIGEAFAAGAQAFVAKSRLESDLSTAIREAEQGRFFISPSIRYPQ